ncbi:hypothetical protein [Shimia abyssi]|uniref:Major facilitator superfamily (MFS) profile domain-containing protein n=1 Tax=Shimia abyssi TaxID=1662395 RepID=A0A2P8F8W0_9RHOB|nr:hypothetical protein [Shimia abyssi]PSL18157.1 hypothetical protein CLV88_11281 [Shimia abyssi]
MKRAVYVLSLAYSIFFAWAWIDTATGSMDAAGRGMALGFLIVGIGFTALFVIPALILTIRDKAPKWALGLVLAPGALLIFMSLGALV